MYDVQALVFDNGTSSIKAGFAGDDAPYAIFEPIVGRPLDKSKKDTYVGERAQAEREVLHIKRPISHGMIVNWEDMEAIWHHTYYNKLKVAPQEHPVLMIETPLTPKSNRERLVQTLFESFNVPAMNLTPTVLLATYAMGYPEGLVVDVGEEVTHVVPIYYGCTLPHAIQRLDLAGRDITEYLAKVLADRGAIFPFEIVRDIKEKTGFVSVDFEDQAQQEMPYKLPDGQIITLGRERYQCPEILFKPNLYGLESPGLSSLIFASIKKCDIDIHRGLYSRIVFAGGSSMFEGLAYRVKKDLDDVAPKAMTINHMAAPERAYAAWIGGSIFGSLSTFGNCLFSKADYEESGAKMVHSKFFC